MGRPLQRVPSALWEEGPQMAVVWQAMAQKRARTFEEYVEPERNSPPLWEVACETKTTMVSEVGPGSM